MCLHFNDQIKGGYGTGGIRLWTNIGQILCYQILVKYCVYTLMNKLKGDVALEGGDYGQISEDLKIFKHQWNKFLNIHETNKQQLNK